MKRFMKSVALVAMVAMGLTACQNDIDEQIEVKDSVVVTFVADSAESRTSVNTEGETPVFSWDEVETFKVLEQTDKLAGATNVTYEKDEESGTATITATFDNNSGKGAYRYVTVYPESGYVEAESIESATLSVSANQTMYSVGTYDPNADLMVSMVVEATEQPTEVQPVRFTRLVAVAEMELKNFELEVGDVIKSVTFTAEGKTIAGTITSDLTAPYEGFEAKAGVSSVSVDIPEEGFDSKVYFTLLPTTLAAGEKYTVAIVTEKYLYAKTGEIPEGKSLAFEAGNVTRFGVNMSGVAKGDKWVLVRDASELKSGDVVTFAAANKNRVMGAKYSGTSYPYASYTQIIKFGDYFYHPQTPANAAAGDNVVQELIVVRRDENKDAFDFYNDVDYTGDTKNGYIRPYTTANNLQLNDFPNDDTLFDVTIEDAVATVFATGSQYNHKQLYYYNQSGSTTNSMHRFACTNSPGQYHDGVCIYKLEGAEPVEIPTPGANITISNSSTALVIEKEGVQEETHLEKVTFNYVGDWTISVSDNADWLTVEYDAEKNRLTYTAQANEGEVRYATVTITATHAGEEDIVKSFEVLQKGAPIMVTIEDFNQKEKNLDVEYTLTGKITEVSTSNSTAYTLQDAEGTNEVQIKYLKDAEGNYMWSKEVLEVGDVLTVTTVVTSSKVGGDDTHPSLYVGHYNISATATPDLVSYEDGSEATITIAKEGNLEPGTITGSLNVAESVATLTHNAGETTATITFAENSGVPREVTATFTDGLATTEVILTQGSNPAEQIGWSLVTDASTLENGDKVMIVAKEYDVALGEYDSTYTRRKATTITKIGGGKYVIPAVGAQTLVLAEGAVDGTFAFYDANQQAFLTSTSGSYKLGNLGYISEDASFEVTIEEGVATIVNTSGSYSSYQIYYRSGGSYNYFYSDDTAKDAVCIYKLEGGAKGTIPVIPAEVTVPTVDVVIEKESAEGITFEGVTFDYIRGWTISAEVTEGDEWLSVAYDEERNILTYDALSNDDEARYANVLITATCAGEDDMTWDFDVLQKGTAKPCTIAEFLATPVNESTYVRYQVTGKIITAPNGSSGACTIEDETGELVVGYIKTEANKTLSTAGVTLAVGDVITIDAPHCEGDKAGTTTNLYSFYRGYYRLTATVNGVAPYAGGDVTIDVTLNVNGEIEAPETISSANVVVDGGAYNFTDNGNRTATATVTFGENTTSAARELRISFSTGEEVLDVNTTAFVEQDVNPELAKGWLLVTDASKLNVGDKVIVAATGVDYAISTVVYTNSRKSTAIVKKGNTVVEVSASVQQYTLEAGTKDNTFAFKGTLGTDANKYLCATKSSSTSKYMGVNATLDDNGSWTIAVDADGIATIQAQGSNTSNIMQYDKSDSTEPSFFAYASATQGAVCLYKYYE